VYTQCSKCETVFKLSAEVLRAASGQVRCGRCGEVFNALARLAEDSTAFSAGESPLEMETRADSILESTVAVQEVQAAAKDHEEFGPVGVEIAQLEILDTDAADNDRSMEFTLPPGELDRIFVESKKRASPAAPETEPEADAAPQHEHEHEYEHEHDPVAEHEHDPVAVHQHDPVAEPGTEAETEPEPHPESAAAAARPAPHAKSAPAGTRSPPHPESAAAGIRPAPHRDGSAVVDAGSARDRVSGFEVPDEVRRDMLAGVAQGIHDQRLELESALRSLERPNAQRQLILWTAAAIVCALLLIVQVAHQNREWFVNHAHGPFGAAVRALYGAMGAPLPQPANLSAYQLRQWGVTGDPDANGILKVRASILNTAAQLQSYPLLRVTLADRFGKRIGARDFEPTEYLGKPTARLLTPGERADATLEILDPGKNAEGFEIDVCLRGVDRKISCANDVAAQTATR
jgi:predicted Zn finger-like uncharacterized protein